MKWCVFVALWIAGLLTRDALVSGGFDITGSRMFFFGGMWMLLCVGAKDVVAGYQEAKLRGKRAIK